MFISDEHVVLDILLIQPNYADRPAASIAYLRVIVEVSAERGVRMFKQRTNNSIKQKKHNGSSPRHPTSITHRPPQLRSTKFLALRVEASSRRGVAHEEGVEDSVALD